MADRIMMTPQELDDGASFLRLRLETINQEVVSLKSKVDDISSRWEGSAQQTFIVQFENDLYPILRDTLPEVIEGVASQLGTAAEAIRLTDDELSTLFKS
jgi:WXG100 family type VII secretion target